MNPCNVVIDILKGKIIGIKITEFPRENIATAHPHLAIEFNGAGGPRYRARIFKDNWS